MHLKLCTLTTLNMTIFFVKAYYLNLNQSNCYLLLFALPISHFFVSPKVKKNHYLTLQNTEINFSRPLTL